MHSPSEVLNFWFSEPVEPYWFSATETFDASLKKQFEPLWKKASQGMLDAWSESPETCLALIVVLDQFPLNMYRNQSESFSTEQQAVAFAKHAISNNYHAELSPQQCLFLFMPLMHSEELEDQKLSVSLFQQTGLEHSIQFAKHHCALIERFGRFPHRNKILGRESTAEELAYLDSEEAFLG